MKYFTPELYVLGNSPKEADWERQDAEWERQIKRYQRHYRKIKKLLPESVRRFHDDYELHDADVFGPARFSNGARSSKSDEVVLVAQNTDTLYAEHLNTLMILHYTITAKPIVELPVPSDVFHPGHAVWLYDEIDVVKAGDFLQEVLLSDGRVLKIRFREFRLEIAPLVGPVKYADLKKLLGQKAASKSKKKAVPA